MRLQRIRPVQLEELAVVDLHNVKKWARYLSFCFRHNPYTLMSQNKTLRKQLIRESYLSRKKGRRYMADASTFEEMAYRLSQICKLSEEHTVEDKIISTMTDARSRMDGYYP